MHYHYLTLEQREALETLVRAQMPAGPRLEESLARLHEPDYGVCIECRQDIGFGRLREDPYVAHCRACARLPIPVEE